MKSVRHSARDGSGKVFEGSQLTRIGGGRAGRFRPGVLIGIAAAVLGLVFLLGALPSARSTAQGRELQDIVPEFDGEGDYVELDNIYTSEGEIALSTWVYIPIGSGPSEPSAPDWGRQSLFWNGAGWNRKGLYLELTSDRGITLQLGDGEGEIRQNAGAITEDEWTHIHVQWIDGSIEHYVNGEKIHSDDWDAGYRHNPDFSAKIGAMRDGDEELGRFFDGRLADFAIWDRGLSASEIRESMEGIEGNEDGLVGYWPMDEGSGETVRDLAGDNDGRFEGEPRWVLAQPFETDLADDRVVSHGDTVTLGPVELDNPEGDVSYQWYFDDEPIDGATESSLKLSEITGDDMGVYHVMADDARDLTPVQSRRVEVGLDYEGHFAKNLEEEKVVSYGDTVTLGPVELSDPKGDVSYQWYFDDEPIDGASESTLTIEDMGGDDAGSYYVEVEDGWETPVDSNSIYVDNERGASARVLGDVKKDAPPEEIYGTFNRFCMANFSAEIEPLVYDKFGEELELRDEGFWLYESENSAVIGWESNLPATSHVEYGATEDLGEETDPTDRHYFLHIHHLTGLEPGQRYHYRFVGIDERGNRLEGPIETFQAREEGSMIHVGEEDQDEDGKIVIDEPGDYLLAGDITSTGHAIEVDADDVTLDLGGNTVTYATEAVDEGEYFEDKWSSYDKDGLFGVQVWGQSGFTLLNGTVKQGPTDTGENVGNDDTSGFNPVYIRGVEDLEVAGVVVDYHSPQNTGMMNRQPQDDQLFHHNVVRDRGASVRNRHGAGCRAIHFYTGDDDKENHVVRNNLVARARQNGLNLKVPGSQLLHNEVYIDSWSTNSFAMGVPNGADEDDPGHYGNRIFATGFNPYGFGWASENLRIHDNLIYMHGLDTEHRWYEDWGDVDLLAALRITNYGDGGQERKDLRYSDNLIIMRGQEGADVQGSRLMTDETVEDVVFENNIVKAERLDDVEARNSGAVVTHGKFRKDDSLPLYYRDSTLISNYVIVQFGGDYSRGNNHRFENVRFVRIGDDPDFATFRFGGQYHSKDHVILDGVFEGGAAPDDVWWHRTGDSEYAVQWTLELRAEAGAGVRVTDARGEVEFEGEVGDDGELRIPLTQAKYSRGEEPRESEVSERTPHTVQVTVDGEQTEHEVEMTEQRELDLR